MGGKQPQNIFVALSGGVDSSVAAALLKEAGYTVTGIYMKEWAPEGIACTSADERAMAARAAAHLNIPFAVWDFSADYKREVADYMLREYAKGHTPNPDVMCNKVIKFGLFLERALIEGADFIATGHYIKNQNSKLKTQNYNLKLKTGYKLIAANDSNKDQSYFLWTLTQQQLARCLFPVGNYTKPQVRSLAKKFGLPNWDKKDSQGVCFVGKFNFAEFLRTQIPQRTGVVVTTTGEEIGTHDGVQYYTEGQRHGLQTQKSKIKSQNYNSKLKTIHSHALYVVGKNVNSNTLIVGEELDPMLYRKELVVREVNWIAGKEPDLPLLCQARIRYRQPLQDCTVFRGTRPQLVLARRASYELRAMFDDPQRAIAPGQSVVFYKGTEMLGGGVIENLL